jgi:hypothetical protein
MPAERIGDVEHVVTADHPARTDSPEYVETRKWLMTTPEGCYVCGGPVDMSHPGAPVTANMQDHHGGGIFLHPSDGGAPILVGVNLFGMEWSLGWGASPARVAAYVAQLNVVTQLLGGTTYESSIATTADVMAYVDSPSNANVKLCAQHHIAHETADTPDVNGHQAVGIHNGPFPIWLGQATCDWGRPFDMWGGTTGTVAVAPHPDGSGKVVAVYVSPLHPDRQLAADNQAANTAGQPHVLSESHPIARLAHAGPHKAP